MRNEKSRAEGAVSQHDGPRPRFFTMDTAVVRYAVPTINAYIVVFSNSPTGVVDGLGEYAFALGSSSLKYGAMGTTCYAPGTFVLVARLSGGSGPDGSSAPASTNIIIGAVPHEDIVDPTFHLTTELSPGSGVDHYTAPFASSLQAAMQDTEVLKDRSYGAPLDSLPGDWSVVNDFGAGVRVGHMGSTFGHPRAGMLADPVTRKLSLMADNLDISGLGSESGWRLDKADLFWYERRARSILEGLGVVEGKAFKKNDSGVYEPLKDGQKGVFRTERLEGELADGVWGSVSMPEQTKARDSKREPPPFCVSSDRATYDGLREVLSADSLVSLKTPYVPMALDLEPENTEEDLGDDASSISWRENADIDWDDYPNLAPANHTDEFEYDTEEFWHARMRGRTKHWKIPSPDDIKKAYGLDMDKRRELEPIDDKTQDYDLPPSVTLTDPVTKREKTYFAADSFIRQLPDGSISISDGYGSEIRMVRGRIIISPSTDLELRPGRDSMLLAGRHVVSNAHANTFIQSANGTLYVKAETDLALLAGNSGDGTLLLESRGKHKSKGHSNESDQRVEGGIMVKSKGGLGLVGSQVYLGILDEKDSSKGGVDGDKGLRTSSIIIDARAGVLGLAGGTIYGSAKNGLVMGCHEGNGSMLALGVGSYSLVASRGALGSSITRIGPPSGSVSIPKITASGVFPSTVIGGEGQGQVDISGSITVEKDATAGGKMHANSMEAPGFSSASGSHKDYSHKGGSSANAKVGKVTVPVAEKVSTAASSAFRICADQYKINTGAAQAKTGMAYPEAEDLGLGTYTIYATRWQNMMNSKSGFKSKWDEPVVKSVDKVDTRVYPGTDIWSKNNFVLGIDPSGTILNKGYGINAKQKEWSDE